MKHSSSAV